MGNKKRFHQKPRPTTKPTRVGRHQDNDNDPIERLLEWQDHRYDPGYYTGGNIHPLFTGRRPNKYGYYLIGSGAMTLIVVVLAIKAGAMPLYAALTLAPLLLLVFVAGFKLVRKQEKRDAKAGGQKKGKMH